MPLSTDKREIRRRHLVRETLADEAREVVLVVQHVVARDHAAGAVAEHEHRQPRLTRPRELHDQVHVGLVLRKLVDVVPLAIGLAAAAQIERIDRKPARDELLRGPEVVAAVRIEAVHHHDDRARLALRPPPARENPQSACAVESFFAVRHRVSSSPSFVVGIGYSAPVTISMRTPQTEPAFGAFAGRVQVVRTGEPRPACNPYARAGNARCGCDIGSAPGAYCHPRSSVLEHLQELRAAVCPHRSLTMMRCDSHCDGTSLSTIRHIR